jgi:hypothetical protein
MMGSGLSPREALISAIMSVGPRPMDFAQWISPSGFRGQRPVDPARAAYGRTAKRPALVKAASRVAADPPLFSVALSGSRSSSVLKSGLSTHPIHDHSFHDAGSDPDRIGGPGKTPELSG